jgi:hypothetical protein
LKVSEGGVGFAEVVTHGFPYTSMGYASYT